MIRMRALSFWLSLWMVVPIAMAAERSIEKIEPRLGFKVCQTTVDPTLRPHDQIRSTKLNKLGMTEYRQKYWDLAIEYFIQAVESDCSNILAVTNLMATLSKAGMPDSARWVMDILKNPILDKSSEFVLKKLFSDPDYKNLFESGLFTQYEPNSGILGKATKELLDGVLSGRSVLQFKIASCPFKVIYGKRYFELPQLNVGLLNVQTVRVKDFELFCEAHYGSAPCDDCESAPPGSYGTLRLKTSKNSSGVVIKDHDEECLNGLIKPALFLNEKDPVLIYLDGSDVKSFSPVTHQKKLLGNGVLAFDQDPAHTEKLRFLRVTGKAQVMGCPTWDVSIEENSLVTGTRKVTKKLRLFVGSEPSPSDLSERLYNAWQASEKKPEEVAFKTLE